ncbi:galactose-specific lectin nattectin isoform X1 [Perca flavescens]|uniref:galactose-specific lectin nattectin isoform X1 n=1 Tax=Perca flavescens TaxID=8167 RepID=UPI00106E6952|nr:galactose-specific lectin nattectin-like isoform X1 [Perca flavescens]
MASGFLFALLLCLSIGLLAPSCYGQTCPGSCPPGWTQFGSRCFSFYFQGKSWIDAENFCKSDGGNLASVHSEEEHEFLRTYIRKVTGENKRTWIGGFDSVQVPALLVGLSSALAVSASTSRERVGPMQRTSASLMVGIWLQSTQKRNNYSSETSLRK